MKNMLTGHWLLKKSGLILTVFDNK